MQNKVRVGIVQMRTEGNPLEPNLKEDNLQRALRMGEEMVKEGVDLLVLPADFYGASAYGPINSPDEFPGRSVEALRQFAGEHKVFIASSSTAHMPELEFLKFYHIGFLIGADGKLIGTQKKIHTHAKEADFIVSGNSITVFDTTLGKIGLLIDLDLLFPEIARKMKLQGAEILLSPILAPSKSVDLSDRVVEYPRELYRVSAQARALENQVFLVMVNGVGKHYVTDLPLSGNSMVVSPLGVIEETGSSEASFIVELDSHEIERAKNFPFLDRRNTQMCRIDV